MIKRYEAIAINPNGEELDRTEFEYDTHGHESYSNGMDADGLYLTIDAPGVADWCRRFIEPGYLELTAMGLSSGLPLFVCDEDGIAKGYGTNEMHDLTRAYAEATGWPLRGTVVAVREVGG